MHSSGISGETIEFPYSPPLEYDYKIVFVREKGVQALRMVCCRGNQFMWVMSTQRSTMEFTDFPADAAPQSVPLTTSLDGEHTCMISVRKSRLQAFLDGALVCSVDTDYSNLSINRQFPRHLRDSNAIGLDFLRNAVTVKSAELTEITGQGTKLRSGG